MGIAGGNSNEKVALITGAGIGIGRGIAKVLAEKGYRLALTYHSSEEDIRTVGQDIAHIYGKVPFVMQRDLTIREEAEHTVKKTMEELGRIDLLVNNAGIGNHAVVA